MAAQRRSEPARTVAIRTWKDFPPLNVTLGDMRHNRTGSWRYIKPLYEDKVPACQDACPAGNDIEGWIKLLQKGRIDDAYRHLKREEPFPAVLGRVCFGFCEAACNRAPFDHCVGIRAMERYIGDRGDPSQSHPDLPDAHDSTLAVIGSGPAGMSAAYFARLLGFRVTLFEKEPQMGGMLRLGIPAYRLPRKVVDAELTGLAKMGIALRPSVDIGRDLSLETLLDDYDYLFLASGNHVGLRLRIEGEARCTRIMSGLGLLRRVAAGRPPALGNRVAVIGGGNTAVDAARTAVRLGCAVTVIYRRSAAEMPAHAEAVDRAREEGVRFRFLAAPEKIELAGDGTITGLVCSEMALGRADDSGRRRPRRKAGSLFKLQADSILTAIGEAPHLEYLAGRVPSAGANLPVDSSLRISTPAARIYAGGDIVDIPHTVAHAVAAGKRAAVAMDCDRRGADVQQVLAEIKTGQNGALSFSRYRGWCPVNPVRSNLQKVVASADIVYDYFQKSPPQEEEVRKAADRKTSFVEYRRGFDTAQARQEVQRCLHCGRCTECDTCLIFCPDMSVLKNKNGAFGYSVNFDYCKGCGICFTECPRSAITMIPEAHPLDAPPEET